MTISEGKTVSIEYTLTLEDKEVIDTNVGGEPLTYVHGSNQMIPGLEKAMEGMQVGESMNVTVAPEDGYGQTVQEAIIEIDKAQLPPEVFKVGAHVQGQAQEGQVVRGQVTGIDGHTAVIDFNHPLAGKTLFFDVKVLEIK